jgi:SpoVK/Ycf46/Vps4 family AAA+-type ATPase
MSLSLKEGFPLCTVKNNNKYVTIYVQDDENNEKLGNLITLPTGHKFQLIPPAESFRIAIFGPTGVGKSTLASSFLKEYHKRFKNNKIFMVSPTRTDEAYQNLKIGWIKIDDTLITDPIDVTEFKDCCIVFDDSEVLSTKKNINTAVEIFRNQALENGRKLKIGTIVINHVIQNGNQTKKVLNECNIICVFIKGNFHAIEKLCKIYLGFDKKTIDYIRNLKSRWAIIKSTYPQVIISEHEVKLV